MMKLVTIKTATQDLQKIMTIANKGTELIMSEYKLFHLSHFTGVWIIRPSPSDPRPT